MTAADLIAAIEAKTGQAGRRNGSNTRLLCPAHDDHHPSLDVAEGEDGRPLTVCRSQGCTFEQVVAAVGHTPADFLPAGDDEWTPHGPALARYPYTDESGRLLFEVCRTAGKQFPVRRPESAAKSGWRWNLEGTRRVLYRLPQVLAAVLVDATVYVVEGEKDVQALAGLGLVATCNPGGAGKWRPEYADTLAGARHVVVLPDDDQPGRDHAEQVAESLHGRVGQLQVVHLSEPPGSTHRDVADFLAEAMFDPAAELARAVEQAPEYQLPEGAAQVRPSGAALVAETPSGGNDRLRLTKIADVPPKRVEWLEEGQIARGLLTGLVAPGGTVKGLYGVHLATRAAVRGEPTLFVCSEDALDYIVRPRFLAAGCDAELAFALSIDGPSGERVPHFPSDLPYLRQAIEESRPGLVILDPVASYIDPGLDMGKNNEMRLILQPLIALARDLHVAILVVYHLGKARERGAIGSVAFEDACRVVLTAARDDDDDDVRHVELTKSNIGPTGYGRKLRIVSVPLEIEGELVEVPKLVDEGRSWKSVQVLLARRQPPGPEPEKRKLARDLLVRALVAAGTKGVNAEEAKLVVAEGADVSTATVWRAFTELKDEGLAAGDPTRDEFGSIVEWRWVGKLALLVGAEGA